MHIVNRKSVLITALISIVIFVIAFYVSDSIYRLMIPKIPGISYTLNDPQEVASKILLLSIIFGLTPSFCLVIWIYVHIDTIKRRLISVGLILACISVGILAKRSVIRKEAKLQMLYSKSFDVAIEPSVNLNYENFTPYILAGIVTGGVASIFLLRKNHGHKTSAHP